MSYWRDRPTYLEEWDETIDTILALDENGTTDLEGIAKNLSKYLFSDEKTDDRWFTLSGVLMYRTNFLKFKEDITELKLKYWEDGKYEYKSGLKRVVFHSRDIRKREGPFNPKNIHYNYFIDDLTNLIINTPFSIYSSSINKVDHVQRYMYPHPVYSKCMEFVLERYCMQLNREGKTGALWLESRGKKEDQRLLDYIVHLIDNGNVYCSSEMFNCIRGVYFNPKWCKPANGQLSYILLELADLVSYPIHKYVRSDYKDPAYTAIEAKIYNYPWINGYGLKKFP